MQINTVPEGMPILSRGKHRNPRRGACFMEMASILAGERWSDRPRCTHPLLADLARMVNDHTTDAGRQRLVRYVPSVVGVHGGGLAWEVSLTAAVAREALPQVPEQFQRPLAVGLLRCEELASSLGPGAVAGLDELRAAVAGVPRALAFAQGFIARSPRTPASFGERSAPHILSCAVRGIVESAAPDVDTRLCRLLVTAIDTARTAPPRFAVEPGGGVAPERVPTGGDFRIARGH